MLGVRIIMFTWKELVKSKSTTAFMKVGSF